MLTTDTTESGLERLICTALAGHACDPSDGTDAAAPRSASGGAGWSGGRPVVKAFNKLFGNIPWEDADRVRQLITETSPSRVAEDAAFQNALRNSDEQNARVEHANVLQRVMKDEMKLFKEFTDSEGFKCWMVDTVYRLASGRAAAR